MQSYTTSQDGLTCPDKYRSQSYEAPNQSIFPTFFYGLFDFLYAQLDFLRGQLDFLYG